MVVQYISMVHIIDLCEETVWLPGWWVAKRWWYQEGLDLARARAAEEEGGAEEPEGEAAE